MPAVAETRACHECSPGLSSSQSVVCIPWSEWIPLSGVHEFSFKSPGILSIGEIKIETDERVIGGKIHKNSKKAEMEEAKKFIEGSDAHPGNNISGKPAEFGDITDRAVISGVRIAESYGFHLDVGEYKLEIDSEGITLTKKIPLVSVDSYQIHKSDIQFEEISTSEKRNFSSENISRYINQVNPLLDDAAPSKKKNKRLVKIPLYSGSGHVTLQTKEKKDIRAILNSLSKLDPRMRSSTSDDNFTDTDRDPLQKLKHRLAEGEISTEEFEKRKEYLDE